MDISGVLSISGFEGGSYIEKPLPVGGQVVAQKYGKSVSVCDSPKLQAGLRNECIQSEDNSCRDDLAALTRIGDDAKKVSMEIQQELDRIGHNKILRRSISDNTSEKACYSLPTDNSNRSKKRRGVVFDGDVQVKLGNATSHVTTNEKGPSSQLQVSPASLLQKLDNFKCLPDAFFFLRQRSKSEFFYLRKCNDFPEKFYGCLNCAVIENRLFKYIKNCTMGLFRESGNAKLLGEYKEGIYKTLLSEVILNDPKSLSAFFKNEVGKNKFFSEDHYEEFVSLLVKFPDDITRKRATRLYIKKITKEWNPDKIIWFFTVIRVMKYAVETAPMKSDAQERRVDPQALKGIFANPLFHWQIPDDNVFRDRDKTEQKLKQVQEWGINDPKVMELILNVADISTLVTELNAS